MRVCVLSHLYPNPIQPTKGVFVQQHVQALRAEGLETAVISPIPWVPPVLSALRPEWRELRSLSLSWEGPDETIRYPRFFTLPRGLWRRREGGSIAKRARPLLADLPFDLIHAHTAVPDGDASRLLAQERGIPFLCTVHGYDFRLLRVPGAVREVVLRTFHAAARVVCVSERVRRACLEYDPRPDHFVVIHHGVTVPEDLPREQSATCPVMLSAGNLIPQKGFAGLIRAFSEVSDEFPQARLEIVGEGPERGRLQALIHALGLNQRVLLLGRLPHAQLLARYSQATVFCLASRDEGFGLVYLEAMARGLPVIGSEGEGIADIVVSGENGLLVNPRDPASIASALRRVLADADLRERLGEAGRRTVEEKLTWSANARSHISLYRHALAAHGANATCSGDGSP